jgi:hypothetical protein
VTAWPLWHRRLRAVPAPAWPLSVILVSTLVFRVWWMAGFIVTTAGVVLCVQRATRGRVRRLQAEVVATGGGVWLGQMPVEEAEALWGESLPFLVSYSYFAEGYPVTLVADENGLTLSPRGLLLPRLGRLKPTLIPWTDQAGARSRRLGYNSESGTTLWLVPLTKITIDLVGPSAAGHLWPMSEEEVENADGQGDFDPDPSDEEDADDEAFWRQSHGPDWRRGTEPLHFTTSEPTGLVDLVLLRSRGRPADTVLP